MSGQIIDASIIAAPRQRNTDAEKVALKEGRIPDEWAARPSRLAQKDRDARWTLKRAKARPAKADGTKAKVEIAVPIFGDMSHVSIDRKHGFVRRFTVTSAAAHDGAQLANVLTRPTRRATSGPIPAAARPRSDAGAAQANHARSKVRSAVETVFAGQKHRFGLFVHTIGLAQARTKIGLANLAYNLKRFLWIEARPVAA